MNVSAISQVSHRGLSNLTKSALLAGAMATSPVTALPVNETNNPKTEYTTDMKDMPYYPVFEITAPQTKAEETTGEKFIEWLTEVLTSINTENYNLEPELMAKKNTPYYFEIPNAWGDFFDLGYEDLATDIITALDNNRNGSIDLTPDDNYETEFDIGLRKAINNWAEQKFSENAKNDYFWNFHCPIEEITDLKSNYDNHISKLEVESVLYALDAISGMDGEITAEGISEQLKYYYGIINNGGDAVEESDKNNPPFSAKTDFKTQQEQYYNMRANDHGEDYLVW